MKVVGTQRHVLSLTFASQCNDYFNINSWIDSQMMIRLHRYNTTVFDELVYLLWKGGAGGGEGRIENSKSKTAVRNYQKKWPQNQEADWV